MNWKKLTADFGLRFVQKLNLSRYSSFENFDLKLNLMFLKWICFALKLYFYQLESSILWTIYNFSSAWHKHYIIYTCKEE